MSAGPFAEAVLAQILDSGRRERRRRRGRIAAAAVALTAAIAGAIAWHAGPVAAEVEIRIRDGVVEVRLTDDDVTAQDVRDAFAREGLHDVEVEAVPAGPSDVGKFVAMSVVGEDGTGLDGQLDDDLSLTSFTIAEDWNGVLTIMLGRPARPGETYLRFVDAFAPEESLRCAGVLGQPLRAAAPRLEGLAVRVQSAPVGGPADQLGLAEGVAQVGDLVVIGGIGISSDEVLLELGDGPAFEERGC